MAKFLRVLMIFTVFIVYASLASSSLDDDDDFDDDEVVTLTDRNLTTRMGETTTDDCKKQACTKTTNDELKEECKCDAGGANGKQTGQLFKRCVNKLCRYCGKYKGYCSFGNSGDGGTGIEYGKVKCCDDKTIKIDYGRSSPPPDGVECRGPPDGRYNRRWRCFAKPDYSS